MILTSAAFFIIVANLANAFRRFPSRLWGAMLAIVMWFVYWTNDDNADRLAYETMYEAATRGDGATALSVEEGFTTLMVLSGQLGLTFQQFLMVLSGFGFICIHAAITHWTRNTSLALLGYMIYPFILDVIQVRNFVAMAVVSLLLAIMAKSGSWRSRFTFVAGVLLLTMIHRVSFFYLPLALIVHRLSLVRFSIGAGLVGLGGGVVMWLGGQPTSILEPLAQNLQPVKADAYVTSSQVRYGFLMIWFLELAILGFLALLYKAHQSSEVGKDAVDASARSEETRVLRFLYLANAYMLCFFPLYLLSLEFFRVARNLMLLNFAAAALTRGRLLVASDSRGAQPVLTAAVFSFGSLALFLLPVWDRVVAPVLGSSIFAR